MKAYEVTIADVKHVLLLDEEDVKRYPDAKPYKANRAGKADKPDPDPTEPAGNASQEDWAKFAVEVKGAKPEDLVDSDGKELGRDELKAKFAAQG